MSTSSCPICELVLAKYREDFQRDIWECFCHRCGRFSITYECATDLRSLQSVEGLSSIVSTLAAATRQASEKGSFLTITSRNWKDLAKTHAGTRFREKADMLIRHIASKTTEFGTVIPFNPSNDYPLTDAKSPQEFTSLVKFLEQSGVVENVESDRSDPNFQLTLTMKGWDTVEPVSAHVKT